MSILTSACDYLITADLPGPCDVLFVLAGRPERKPYGLELFRQKLAPRLILSVGRFELRYTAALLEMPGLLTLRDNCPPEQRHFWIDFQGEQRQIQMAHMKKIGTFWELNALADYLSARAPLGETTKRIACISTSIHLRRVRYCCSRIPFFRNTNVSMLTVPEESSSFHQSVWWKRASDWRYLSSEYMKLAGYRLLY